MFNHILRIEATGPLTAEYRKCHNLYNEQSHIEMSSKYGSTRETGSEIRLKTVFLEITHSVMQDLRHRRPFQSSLLRQR